MANKQLYNNLSEKYKQKIGWSKPLGRDESVTFELIHIPVVKQNGKDEVFHSYKRIPNVDSVYDPYLKNESGEEIGGMVEIAYVITDTGNEKNLKLGEIEFLKANKSTITITGKEPKLLGLLNFMRASNYNISNPMAKPTPYGYIFKEIEPVKTAQQKLKERVELNDCTNYILALKEAETVSMLKALKQQVFPAFEENQSALVEFVQKKENRDKFNSLSKDVRMPIAALITKAQDLELIRYDKVSKIWLYTETKKEITQVPPQSDNNDHLVEYFHSNKNGKAFKEFLEKEVDALNVGKQKDAAEKVVNELEEKKKK